MRSTGHAFRNAGGGLAGSPPFARAHLCANLLIGSSPLSVQAERLDTTQIVVPPAVLVVALRVLWRRSFGAMERTTRILESMQVVELRLVGNNCTRSSDR